MTWGAFPPSNWAVEGQVRPGSMALVRMHLYKICGTMQATVKQCAGSDAGRALQLQEHAVTQGCSFAILAHHQSEQCRDEA